MKCTLLIKKKKDYPNLPNLITGTTIKPYAITANESLASLDHRNCSPVFFAEIFKFNHIG